MVSNVIFHCTGFQSRTQYILYATRAANAAADGRPRASPSPLTADLISLSQKYGERTLPPEGRRELEKKPPRRHSRVWLSRRRAPTPSSSKHPAARRPSTGPLLASPSPSAPAQPPSSPPPSFPHFIMRSCALNYGLALTPHHPK